MLYIIFLCFYITLIFVQVCQFSFKYFNKMYLTFTLEETLIFIYLQSYSKKKYKNYIESVISENSIKWKI